MNVLVAGGAGYIGSNMVAMLREAGFETVVFDNLVKGHKAAIRDTEFVKGDLSDYKLLLDALTRYKIEAVMHFAAFSEVGESVKYPLKYYGNNLSNAQVLLSAMETANVEKFIFSSTAAVYGMPKQIPITEESAKEPINPYGETKLAIEKMCHYQSLTGRLRYTSLRYFNAAGAGDNCRLGEDHRPESHLIPLVIQAAMGKRPQINLFGTDYSTDDGTCIRDYIHIEDLCRAHLLALEKLDSQTELICNLGNGKGYSVRHVIDTVRKVTATDFKVVESPRRLGDPPVLTADASKAARELGWQPEYTALEDIISTAWQWHRSHPDGYSD